MQKCLRGPDGAPWHIQGRLREPSVLQYFWLLSGAHVLPMLDRVLVLAQAELLDRELVFVSPMDEKPNILSALATRYARALQIICVSYVP